VPRPNSGLGFFVPACTRNIRARLWISRDPPKKVRHESQHRPRSEVEACDYVTKPFGPRGTYSPECASPSGGRRGPSGRAVLLADIVVNFRSMEVIHGGALVSLTAQEFQILKFMVPN
jgi:DNA-binding response OmpR family regulator